MPPIVEKPSRYINIQKLEQQVSLVPMAVNLLNPGGIFPGKPKINLDIGLIGKIKLA